jgi:hypothetical protein
MKIVNVFLAKSFMGVILLKNIVNSRGKKPKRVFGFPDRTTKNRLIHSKMYSCTWKIDGSIKWCNCVLETNSNQEVYYVTCCSPHQHIREQVVNMYRLSEQLPCNYTLFTKLVYYNDFIIYVLYILMFLVTLLLYVLFDFQNSTSGNSYCLTLLLNCVCRTPWEWLFES